MGLAVILSNSNVKSNETDGNSFNYYVFPLQKYDSVWLDIMLLE